MYGQEGQYMPTPRVTDFISARTGIVSPKDSIAAAIITAIQEARFIVCLPDCRTLSRHGKKIGTCWRDNASRRLHSESVRKLSRAPTLLLSIPCSSEQKLERRNEARVRRRLIEEVDSSKEEQRPACSFDCRNPRGGTLDLFEHPRRRPGKKERQAPR